MAERFLILTAATPVMPLSWGFSGAGEGNRTFMTSLEGAPQRNRTTSDLENVLAARDHEKPLLTLANGTLMARRSCCVPERAPWLSEWRRCCH